MFNLSLAHAETGAVALAAERFRELGILAWHAKGDATPEPHHRLHGPALAALSSKPFRRLVANAHKQAPGSLIDQPNGIWTIRLDRPAGSRAVWILAFPARELAGSSLLADCCAEANVDPAAAFAGLERFARWDEPSARALAASLPRILLDLEELADHREANAGFTFQLTNSFETINLLYSIGKAMGDLTHPAEFIAMLCQKLHESGEFGWAAACFRDDPSLPEALNGQCIRRGGDPEWAWFAESARITLARLGDNPEGRVVPDDNGLCRSSLPKLVAQPLVVEGRVVGAILAGDKTGPDPSLSSYDIQLVEAAGRYANSFLSNSALYAAQRAMFVGTVRALSAAIDAKDPYTQGHSERVAHLSRQLALATGSTRDQGERVHIAGLVHDVGKIGVPEAVLCKQGRLTDEEFAAIKKHPEIGARILEGIKPLADVLPGVMHHHERFDGRGYPHGIAGEAIPQMARIIAVADTFDAMSSTRSYRAAMPREKVLAEIVRCAGSQFDPKLAHVFVGLDLSEYDRMVANAEARLKPAA